MRDVEDMRLAKTKIKFEIFIFNTRWWGPSLKKLTNVLNIYAHKIQSTFKFKSLTNQSKNNWFDCSKLTLPCKLFYFGCLLTYFFPKICFFLRNGRDRDYYITLNTTLKYFNKQVLNKKLKLMGEVINFFFRKIH